MPLIPGLGGYRQEEQEFKVILGDTGSWEPVWAV